MAASRLRRHRYPRRWRERYELNQALRTLRAIRIRCTARAFLAAMSRLGLAARQAEADIRRLADFYAH